MGVKSDEKCLKQDKGSFTHGNMVKTFIVYESDIWSCDLSAFCKLRLEFKCCCFWCRQ